MQGGFGNHITSEAILGAVPKNQNNPQKPPLGLYAEQISGSAFTQKRAENLRSWMYRILPSVKHSAYEEFYLENFLTPPLKKSFCSPIQYRFDPPEIRNTPHDFLEGVKTIAVSGDRQCGVGVHLFTANTSMKECFFLNSDGHLLILPQIGHLELHTEFGLLAIAPKEMAVIPKGIKFQVHLKSPTARGYICENFGFPFILPDLGPIGSNGLANPRHFLAPSASFNDQKGEFYIIHKFAGQFFKAQLDYHPLNVLGWCGNYFPYKYDLTLFNVLNSVSFDHTDPSIFTVLTSPSFKDGLANVDFVIFPPRWIVAENTFRPPYYHRNIMSEFMGLICGVYDAKEEGFLPGGSTLHNSFAAHGPDAQVFQKASQSELKPEKHEGSLAFMFESSSPFTVTDYAHNGPLKQDNYNQCWQNLKDYFKDSKL